MPPPTIGESENILVVPVPDTSVFAAEGYADTLGLRHGQAIIKDRYSGSGRSFIAADQQLRQELLKVKHSFLPGKIRGRDIIIIDDSIVRGNTLPRIVSKIKALGARSVSCLIASPPVRFPDHYGINTPAQDELMAANLTVAEMQTRCNADYLAFLSLEGMIKATGVTAEKFNLASFNGEYPIDIGQKNRDNIRKPVSMQFAA